MFRTSRVSGLLLLAIGVCACGDNQASRTLSVPNAEPRASMQIGTNLWGLSFRRGATWDDVFRPEVDFATATNPWNPAFLEEAGHYQVIRFMDFGKVNNSTERSWSERTWKTDRRPAQERLAYEWMIDLCNRTGADIWINLPAEADDIYAFELAKLLQSELDPSRTIFVEWSNETWNSGFSQQQYAIDQGLALGLDRDPATAGAKFHVYRALRIFSQFEAVLGADNPRLVRVIAGQSVNTYLTGIHLAALKDDRINPTGMSVDVYAIAPYFGRGVDGLASNVIDQLADGVASAIDDVRLQYDLIAPTGMRLVAYEGGQHVTTNADSVNARPEMYDLYTRYLDGISPYLSIFTHYVHNGRWGSGGSWGAESYVGQPLSEAHKLRAMLDWMSANP